MNFVRKVLSLFTLTHELKFALRKFLPQFDALVQKHTTIASAPLKERYTLMYSASMSKCTEFPTLYFNTGYGFILCVLKDGMQIPIAGIEFEHGFREVVVHRLRYVEGMKDYLDPLLWERLLYEAVVKIFSSLTHTTMIRRVCTCSPKRSPYNLWEHPEFCGSDLPVSKMEEHQSSLEIALRRIPRHVGFAQCEGGKLQFLL